MWTLRVSPWMVVGPASRGNAHTCKGGLRLVPRPEHSLPALILSVWARLAPSAWPALEPQHVQLLWEPLRWERAVWADVSVASSASCLHRPLGACGNGQEFGEGLKKAGSQVASGQQFRRALMFSFLLPGV